MSPRTDARARSRRGRFPDPAISWLIGVTELRRYWRKLSGQDLWLILAGIGFLFILIGLPLLFGLIRQVGRDFSGGDPMIDLISIALAIGWLLFLAFGVISGVGSEGEIDDQDGLLAVRPSKDIAGGLVVYLLLGYLPFLVLPVTAGAAGFAVGIGSIWPIVGIVLAAVSLYLSATLTGYAAGLWLKGVIRRSPWLWRLKPLLGLAVIVGYFWLAFTGNLFPWLTEAAELLIETPIGWLGDLAMVTTREADASVAAAAGAAALAGASIPVTLWLIVRLGEYAWFVDTAASTAGDDRSTPSEDGPTAGDRLNRVLTQAGVKPATRGIAVVVLIRGYRAPLQLAFVIVPFILLIPVLDQIVRTGIVPDWMPWVVVLYGAWAAGVGFPLNILGNQGATLPRLLTSPATGRDVLHGHLLASVLLFVPLTVALAVGAGMAADRSTVTLGLLVGASVVAVVAGSVLGAGIGAAFPRFSSISLTENTEAVLPSKTAFGLFSVPAVLATSAVGVLVDERYREVVAVVLSEVAPYGLSVTPRALFTGSAVVAGAVLLALPVTYLVGIHRLGSYRVS